jgi:NH3-dependent NAD+ synthetase
MVHIRIVYLFDVAKRLGAFVCGTENRTLFGLLHALR